MGVCKDTKNTFDGQVVETNCRIHITVSSIAQMQNNFNDIDLFILQQSTFEEVLRKLQYWP